MAIVINRGIKSIPAKAFVVGMPKNPQVGQREQVHVELESLYGELTVTVAGQSVIVNGKNLLYAVASLVRN